MDNKKKYAEVIISIESLGLDHPFDYRIPHKLAEQVSIGSVVLVPFQSRLVAGYVVRLKSQTKIGKKQIKGIQQAVLSSPVFNKDRLKLIYWMSFYYVQSRGSVVRLFLPPGGRIKTEKIWTSSHKKAWGISFPVEDKEIKKDPRLYRKIEKLKKEGLVDFEYILSRPAVKLKFEDIVYINPDMEESDICLKRAPVQKRIYSYIQEHGPSAKKKVIEQTGSNYASLKSMVDKNILVLQKERLKREFRYESAAHQDIQPTANYYQKKCLKSITEGLDSKKFCAFLVEGVAGSGKTKVYIDSCREAVKRGKRALVLTPEISLTPQLFERFEKEFRHHVAIYHSNMGIAERYENWLGIAANRYQVVIGTRSAMFAPVNNLGIIILDEEHDASYKENSNVRYNTRDVALRLGKILNIPVVFGSATPSISLRFMALNKEYFKLLKMPVKAGSSTDVEKEVIDMRKGDSFKQNPIISNRLHGAILEEINKKNKVIIFLNRRGYSNFVLCNSCGNVAKCPACNLSFKYHLGPNILRCHHCGRELPFNKKCAKCGEENILLKGIGIQKVEKQLNLRFGDVPVIRMDSDSTTKKKSHQSILDRFMSSSPAILLGTQMIAKGLDIEDVTLVGIINCDSMLELPDYHMYERTYQLICQVAGRAGRKKKKGRVLIQTYSPEHEVIKCFLKRDYAFFYGRELANRKELSYPPFSNIINIIVSGTEQEKVKEDCYRLFTEAGKIIRIRGNLLGPAPSPFYRINRYYRWHVIIKTAEANRTISGLNKLMKNFRKDEGNRIIVDVDPAWIL